MKIRIKKPECKIRIGENAKFHPAISRDFRDAVEGLSYRQLVRVSSFADARNAAEIAEAKHITKSLLPKEAIVVKNISRTSNHRVRKAKIDFLRATLDKKNVQEISSVNSDAVLHNLLKP